MRHRSHPPGRRAAYYPLVAPAPRGRGYAWQRWIGPPSDTWVTSIACVGSESGRSTSCGRRNAATCRPEPPAGEPAPHKPGMGHRRSADRALRGRSRIPAPRRHCGWSGDEHMHPLLSKQLDEAREADGPPDIRKLLLAVSTAYAEWDDERRGVVRSMKLLADETSAAARRRCARTSPRSCRPSSITSRTPF